jgi:hypothetical protein
MILVCEITFTHGHVPFNAGLLATIQAAFPKEVLSFYGAAAHIEELKKQVGQPLVESILWKEILPVSSGRRYVERFFRELSLVRRLLRVMPHGLTSRLVLTSAYPSAVLALKVARWIEFKHLPVQIVLHGLSGVIGKRYRHPIRRFQDMKTALTLLGNNNIQYIVLEQSICDVLAKSLPRLSSRIEALDHPIPPNEGTFQTAELFEPILFGFLGLADRTRGFPVFVNLSNEVSAKYGGRAEFHAIGYCSKHGSVEGIDALATKPTDIPVPRNDFRLKVSALHFVVLPHEAGPYTLTASGVLLDAIAWEKPVIARKIPIFQTMFERHGDIGYLFSDDADLRRIVEQIVIAPDETRYHRQVLNIRSARKSRAPETLAAAYREICKKNE